jgi:hypothetical protein
MYSTAPARPRPALRPYGSNAGAVLLQAASAGHFACLFLQSRGAMPKRDLNQFVNEPCWL